jgi:hypothetical protein
LLEALILSHSFEFGLRGATRGADLGKQITLDPQVLSALEAAPDQLQIREVGASIDRLIVHESRW